MEIRRKPQTVHISTFILTRPCNGFAMLWCIINWRIYYYSSSSYYYYYYYYYYLVSFTSALT